MLAKARIPIEPPIENLVKCGHDLMRYKTFYAVTICGLMLTGTAQAALPQPPCKVAALPAYSAPGAAPTIAIWHRDDLEHSKWRPPSCTGWSPTAHSKLIVALAGSFRFNGDMTQLLERAGAISAFRTIRYWSTTNKEWRPLVNDASALSGPDKANRRADFSASDLIKNATLYYWEDDSRSGEIVYRLSVFENTPDRAVIASENITAIRKFIVTLFKPGTLQSTIFIQRLSPGLFGIYILNRTGEGTSALAEGHDSSYVNRAVALYRQLAGIKTDQEPPAAR
jgi:hypothetical protein